MLWWNSPSRPSLPWRRLRITTHWSSSYTKKLTNLKSRLQWRNCSTLMWLRLTHLSGMSTSEMISLFVLSFLECHIDWHNFSNVLKFFCISRSAGIVTLTIWWPNKGAYGTWQKGLSQDFDMPIQKGQFQNFCPFRISSSSSSKSLYLLCRNGSWNCSHVLVMFC